MALLECKMERSKPLVVLFLALLGNTGSSAYASYQNATPVVSTGTPITDPITKPSTTSLPKKALPSHELAFVRVVWSPKDPCKGEVHLYPLGGKDEHVCNNSHLMRNLTDLCSKTTCGRFKAWADSETQRNGHFVHNNGSVTRQNCSALLLLCKGQKTNKEGDNRELVAYKAITGLLLVLVLGVLLLRFGKPTYAAICKRLSQKRQTRWIGPTQSQSVYYHREQQAGLQPNNNTSKRHSYPALEKLTVASSREPSSNRNSDYSYN